MGSTSNIVGDKSSVNSYSDLLSQLSVARNEIKNLRQQVTNLKHSYKKDVDEIHLKLSTGSEGSSASNVPSKCSCEFTDWKSIGVVNTCFPGKRGVPRQAALCPEAQDNKLYFSGVDMVDGTPVLDIKPYIPQYDDPQYLPSSPLPSSPGVAERLVEGGDVHQESSSSLTSGVADVRIDVDDVPDLSSSAADLRRDGAPSISTAASPVASSSRNSEREAPDGEEGPVRIAGWVSNPPTRTLKVLFSDRSRGQMPGTGVEATITRLLEQDPRSTYLRRKLGNQFYTFRIEDLLVSVKFDDTTGTVTVTSVQSASQPSA